MIYIFEQDCLYIDPSDTELTPKYVKDHLAYQNDDGEHPVDVIVEVDDDAMIIIQGLNSDGESWKFIQARY
jgi:hypothetical protein